MAAVWEQHLAYLTYPAQTGITVTHSQGISPHSAAGASSSRTVPLFFYHYITIRKFFQANSWNLAKKTQERS